MKGEDEDLSPLTKEAQQAQGGTLPNSFLDCVLSQDLTEFCLRLFTAFCLRFFTAFCLRLFTAFCLRLFTAFCLRLFIAFCLRFFTAFCLRLFTVFFLYDEYVAMTRSYFLQYTQLEIPKFRDTLIQHMESVKKSINERAQHTREYDSWVPYTAEYNVFAVDTQPSEQPECINNTYVVERSDSNVILDSPDMCDNDIQNDQNVVGCDDERVALANLIANLKLDHSRGSNSIWDSCLIALQSKRIEFEKYKACNDRIVDYDKLERKLNETLRLLAQKDIDKKEGLKLKAYKILVFKEKHDELVKQILLTKSHYEGLVKEKTKVITDLKLKEEKDIDKMLSMEKQLKFFNEIVYKRNQSIQTIHMLAPKGPTYNVRPTFANPRYLKQAQFKIPCLYVIPHDQSDHVNRLIPDREETLTHERESQSKLNKDLVRLCKEKASNVFQKECEQYIEIQDLKAQLQDKNIAISELKKLIEKMKGKSVDTKFEKPSIFEKPPLQPIRNQTVPYDVNAPVPSMKSLKHVSFQTPRESVGSNDMVHNYYLEEAKKKEQLQNDKALNTKPSVQQSVRLPNTTNGQKFSPNKSSTLYLKTTPSRSSLRWKPTGRIFKTVGLRWVPTGKIFISSTTKVDSEPPNGSNSDITNQYECEQTLNVSACTPNLSAGTSFDPKKEGLRV
uniref:Integrase, catalytic region, zinc finger, CCHC-type, peptidase aspartic, catalytic n=1 Tax=Tanacetum cinerariifolium TaxID=118510 RepID=A0A699GHU2_TANCI|nr:hypothetical protein [Tanacetum cinerariifolium]